MVVLDFEPRHPVSRLYSCPCGRVLSALCSSVVHLDGPTCHEGNAHKVEALPPHTPSQLYTEDDFREKYSMFFVLF